MQELLKDATPFKIVASVSIFLHLLVMFTHVCLFLTLHLLQMSFFCAYIAKYCDIRKHQLSRLSHLRVGAREMYDKERAESPVLQLEKELVEAQLK